MARKKTDYRNEKDYIDGETRGEYLTRILGLSDTPKVERKIIQKKQSSEKTYVSQRQYNFKKEDFIIERKKCERYGLCYAVKHKTWSNDAFIYGGDTEIEAQTFIMNYIEETKKPFNKRSTNFIKLIHEKNV